MSSWEATPKNEIPKALKEEVDLDEGYEKTVLLALKDEGIGGYFSKDILYVAQRKIEDAKAAIKAAGHIKVMPKIMGEEVELDEGKQVLAHGGKGQYKAVGGDGVVDIMYKGKVISTGDFDRGADGWFLSIKGEKGQKFFKDAQKMVDYFVKNKITEEVELGEEVSVKDFDSLKKGDTVIIEYKAAMSSGTSTFNVTAKNTVARGTVEKVTLKSTKNPGGVKSFLYKRNNKVSFAQGDMGAAVVSFKKE